MLTFRAHHRRICALLAAALLMALPASASASANWGFGPSGQKSATITWQPDNGENVTAILFTLPVKAKSAKTRLGHRCTVPRHHPKQVRCSISPAGSYGYIDVLTKVRMPCRHSVQFSVKPVGSSHFVRQSDIPSGNGCS
jgi:hypothetical protein